MRRFIVIAYASMGPGDVVVVGPMATDGADRRAVAGIHARGALAFRYQQWYWQPNGRTYQGYDILTRPGWAFCADGTAPLTDTVQHPGQPWTFVDLNERAARNAQVEHLRQFRAIGYDGVFVDRGAAALTGDQAGTVSRCTENPVVPGRSLAQAYVGMLGRARVLGFTIALNGGPLDLLNARSVGVDAMATARYVLDESGAKRGVAALRANALGAARRAFTSWVLVRPGPHAAMHRAAAAQVPAVGVVHGVRAAEDLP